jgi:cobalamin biosynthesis Mg chelatase CobN
VLLNACDKGDAVIQGGVPCAAMAGTPPEHESSSRVQRTGEELAAEAERARTPRTPALALASVWAVVAVVVAVVVALVFVVYFAFG